MRRETAVRRARGARARRSALILAAALIGAAAPARATDPAPNKCGGTYESGRSKSCTFYFKGFPLLLRGDSIASSARVHVFVTIDGYPEVPPALECRDARAGYAQCVMGIPDETTVVNLPHQASSAFVRLVCHVEGAGEGEYACQGGG